MAQSVLTTEAGAARDPFNTQRRIEQRVPELRAWLPRFAPGYAHNREAATAQLEFLQVRFEPSAAMVEALRRLLAVRG